MPAKALLIFQKLFFFVPLTLLVFSGCASPKQKELIFAAINGQPKKIELLLFNGADINTQGAGGTTALFEATKRGDVKMVRYLVAKGADVNLGTVNRLTPLYVAAYFGYVDIIKLLIRNGADLETTNSEGYTPLIIASERGRTEAVESLINAGFDVNSRTSVGRTPLMFAALRGHPSTVRYLLKKGANTTLRTKNGETSLDHARSGYRSARSKYKWELLRPGMPFSEVRDIAGDMPEPEDLYSEKRVVIEVESGTYIFNYGKLAEWLRNKFFRRKPANEEKLVSFEQIIELLRDQGR